MICLSTDSNVRFKKMVKIILPWEFRTNIFRNLYTYINGILRCRPTEQPEQYPHPTSLVIAQVHAEAGEYFQPPVLAEPHPRPEEEARPIQPLAEVTLQPEKDVRSQVEQPSEMEDIIKLLEADLVAQRTKTTEVAEPPPAPVLEILPEGVAQLPELAAPVQEIIAPEVVAPVAEILPAEQERRAVDAESVRKVPETEEEKEKAGEEKKDEPKKKEADKEKKKKKRVDSKKKEVCAFFNYFFVSLGTNEQ